LPQNEIIMPKLQIKYKLNKLLGYGLNLSRFIK
jgi:hypothetical protein